MRATSLIQAPFRGKSIQDESDLYLAKKGKVEEGGVVVTGAGSLLCKHVFHAVGPMWHGTEFSTEISTKNFTQVGTREKK